LWPDGGEELIFGDELSGTLDQMVQHGISFGPELDYFRAMPQTLV
jgi:hypothetical protein